MLIGSLPYPVYEALACALLPILLWLVTDVAATRRTFAVLLIGSLPLCVSWGLWAYEGHIDDCLIIVAGAGMVRALKHQRVGWLTAAFVFAMLIKPIALLFVPLVFLSSKWAGIIAVGPTGVLWAPFVLIDVGGFLHAGQGVNSSSGIVTGPPRRPDRNAFPDLDQARAVQWRSLSGLAPRSLAGPAVGVLSAFVLRALLEPVSYYTYSTAVLAFALMVDSSRRWPLASFASGAGLVVLLAVGGGFALTETEGLVRLVLLVLPLCLALWPASAERDEGAPPRPTQGTPELARP